MMRTSGVLSDVAFDRWSSLWLAVAVVGLLAPSGCALEDDGSDIEMQVSNLGEAGGDDDSEVKASLHFYDEATGEAVDVDDSDLDLTIEERHPDGEWVRVDDPRRSSDGPPGIDAVVVADNSGSEEGHLQTMQSAIKSFADDLYERDGRTRVGLVRVSSESQPIQNLTPNATQFDAAVDHLFIRDGWTALWDGIRHGNRLLRQGLAARVDGGPRTCVNSSIRAVVAFTDGEDNNSSGQESERGDEDGYDTELSDLEELSVLGTQTPVFTVGIGSWNDEVLTGLSEETGGSMVRVDNYDRLAEALENVGSQLNGAMPVCFELSDIDSTQVRVTVELVYDGETYELQETSDIPEQRCTERSNDDPDEWSPDLPILECDASVESRRELVSLADLGCRGDDGTAVYETALSGDAPDQYRPPTDSEQSRLETLLPKFYDALGRPNADLSPMRSAFGEMGLQLREVTLDGDEWVILTESGETWRGAGGYLFRRGDVDREIVYQAPHSFHEWETGRVTRKLTEHGTVRGYFFNTLHRHYLLSGMVCDPGVYPTDVAHVTNSFFHEFTTAYLDADPDGTIVQLHGHTNQTLLSDDIGTVLSSGTVPPSDRVTSIAESLKPTLADQQVALYSEDTNLYGGTLNIQGRWIDREQRGHFVHVELSRHQRERLIEDSSVLTDFATAIQAAE